MALQMAGDSTGPPMRPNPALCEKCHTWNDVAFLSSKSQSRVYYESHAVDIPLDAACPDCAICGAVYTAAKTRVEWEQSEGRTYTNSLIARNLGPIFMDNEYTPRDRIDNSQPGESRLWVAISIDICELIVSSLVPKPGTANSSSLGSKSEYQEVQKFLLQKFVPRFCLRHTQDIPTCLLGLTPWESPFFEVDLLKSWISACESIHLSDPSSPLADSDTHGRLPVDFRLIDVQSMNVTKPKTGEPFVALSYMWQKTSSEHDTVQLERANLHLLEAMNSLAGIFLPDVIADTIALCRALGERYLWVDRFCIVQDDEKSKQAQICAMNAVYSSAKFTVMAALNKYKTSLGLSGCPKLPGCPGRPRLPSAMDAWHPHDEETRSVRQNFGSVDASMWDHRAWTFQERFLSRCRLFITESQAIFQCNRGQYAAFEHLARSVQKSNEVTKGIENDMGDATTTGPTLKSIKDGQDQVQRSARFLGFNSAAHHIDSLTSQRPADLDFTIYRSLIYGYTQRQLSFRSDILKAFTGLGNVLARRLRTRMLFGLPEKYFHFALRWTMPAFKDLADWEPESAPDYAPSWSWASTQCFKGYQPWSLADMGLDLIHFFYYDSESADLTQPLRKVDAKEHYERGPRRKLGHTALQESFSHIPSVLAQPACEAASRLAGSLVFNTTTIICRLGPVGKSLGGCHPDPEKLLFSQALLAQPSNRSMGVADVDSKWSEGPKSRTGSDIKLVAIAVRQVGIDWNNGNPPAPKPKEVLDVLLVEPDPREPLAVRRIGLGYVTSWELWQSCSPQWETVVLC